MVLGSCLSFINLIQFEQLFWYIERLTFLFRSQEGKLCETILALHPCLQRTPISNHWQFHSKKNTGNNLHGVTRGLNLFQHRSGPGSSIVQSLQTASAIISCFYSNQKNTLQFGPIFCVLFLCG
jgi:hypothetical protein